MPCIQMSDGTVAFILCGRSPRKRCTFCREGYVTKLCDHPVRGKTCDAGMCDKCATSIAPETDYCPPHARHHERQQSLFAGKAVR